MSLATFLHRLRALGGDQGGGISVEYLVVTVFALVISGAVVMLGLGLAASEERATNVLVSNSP
jgi:hypothetical protein